MRIDRKIQIKKAKKLAIPHKKFLLSVDPASPYGDMSCATFVSFFNEKETIISYGLGRNTNEALEKLKTNTPNKYKHNQDFRKVIELASNNTSTLMLYSISGMTNISYKQKIK
jgi:hypothetical protein